MLTGLLWFDNSKKATLEEKVRDAALYYRRKFERAPEICLVNPADQMTCPDLSVVEVEHHKVAVRASRSVAMSHFWIGVEDAPAERP